MEFGGNVTVGRARLPHLTTSALNGRSWNGYHGNAWRHSVDQRVAGDVVVDGVVARRLTAGSTVGGADPGQWLSTSGGGVLSAATFARLDVDGRVDVDDGRVNGVAMERVLTRSDAAAGPVGGVKTWRRAAVSDSIDAPLVNDVSISDVLLVEFQC